MAIKIVTEPTEEPVLLDETLKKHLRVDDDMDDTLIQAYITGARKYVESFLGRALVTQTWDLFLDEFPSTDYIELPFPPLASVTTVKYKDTSDVLQTWDAANYIVDTYTEPGRVTLAYGISWPTTLAETQAVQIRFICGYGTQALVPMQFKLATMLKISDLYEHRGEEAVDPAVDRAIEALCWADRICPV